MDYTEIIVKPLISEKATLMKEYNNQVAFIIHPRANKLEVAKAVEQAFKVQVDKVNIVRYKGRVKSRFGRKTGKEPGYKKAYVTLAEGQKIELFEGV
jgi:large subunit ribosomal protein L23